MKNLTIIIFIVLFSACGFSQDMKKLLIGKKWMHSQQENTEDGSKIYRPEDYQEWGPSRYRQSYEFFEEGKCKFTWLAPNDLHQMLDGTYKIDKENQVIVIYDSTGKEVHKLEVLLLEKNLLRIKR